jgi:hypothetical protein
MLKRSRGLPRIPGSATMRTLGLFLFAVLITGCTASSGVKVDETKLTQFTPGVTTEADITAALGQPSNATHATGGAILTYVFTTSTASAANFIPGLALVKGRTDSATQICQIFLDAKDRFQRSSCSDSAQAQAAPLGH